MTKGKRSDRPRRQRKGRRAGITRLPGTLAPQHMLVKLKYMATLQKSTPLGSVVGNFNQFRLNSIYDPDYTNSTGSTNISALGLANWSGLFQRYRVYKVGYTVKLSHISSDGIVTGALVFQNYLDTSFSISDMIRPLSRRFELGNKEGNNKAVLKGVIHLPKLAGVTPTQYRTGEGTQSGFSTNPASPLYMTILVQASNGSVSASVAAQVDFTYYVEMMSTQASPESVDVATGLPIVPSSAVCTVPGGLS